MKILITGANGQLGYDLTRILKDDNEVFQATRENMDITDFKKVKSVVDDVEPEIIIHCAAYTAVDNAEDDEPKCREVNYLATENIAKICKQKDIEMVYFSTDYVFDGLGDDYFKTDDDIKEQLNVYGKTKYEGEQAIQKYLDKFYIIRISWVFGINGNNFVKTMLRLGKERDSLNVVDDQFGSPTYTYDLSILVADIIKSKKYGIYHATNEGVCSWYEFASEIFKKSKIDVKIHPIASDKYPSKAKRPKNSRLSKDKLDQYGFKRLPHWEDALERYLKELGIV